MKRLFSFIVAAVFVLSAQAAPAKVQSAKLSLDVDAGQWKSVRLRNLPRGAALKALIKSDGALAVSLITEEQYGQYPDISRPLFQGTVATTLSFTVKIPAAGHYYLVFDNTVGARTVKVDAAVAGASGADADLLQGRGRAQPGGDVPKDLSGIGTELAKLFIFKPFSINVKSCGAGGTTEGPGSVVLCTEVIKSLAAAMGSQERSSTALRHLTYRVIGLNLLFQWGYPFYDSEDAADEFAAMLVLLLGQQERLQDVMEYVLSHPGSQELLAAGYRGNRHPFSSERAREVLRWLKDSDRLRRWQPLLVPHMQTALLEHLRKTAPAWSNRDLVAQELARRKHVQI